ncbi:MAG: hypothetical protein JWR07_5541 [Nevskia sp.]|nr:hypothetical protein [Nevskia sp.]
MRARIKAVWTFWTGLSQWLTGLVLTAMGLVLPFEQAVWADDSLPPALRQGTVQTTVLTAGLQLALMEGNVRLAQQWRPGKAADPVREPAAVEAAGAAEQGQAVPFPAQPVGADPGKGFVRLPGHVLSALARATLTAPAGVSPLSPAASAAIQPITLTVVLKRRDQAGFERYLKQVYDPHSRHFHHFLTQAQIAQRFGPTRQGYRQVRSYLQGQGFKQVDGSRNRMTLTLRGTRAQAERAFALNIGDYRIGDASFYANDSDPALPKSLASQVAALSGLSDYARPEQVTGESPLDIFCGPANTATTLFDIFVFAIILIVLALTGPLAIAIAEAALGGASLLITNSVQNLLCLAAHDIVNMANGYGGGSAGGAPGGHVLLNHRNAVQPRSAPQQTVGLLEFDTYNPSDVADYASFMDAMGSTVGDASNVSEVPVNGGVATPGSGESEVLLDIQSVMSLAPDAKVVVYDAPFDGRATGYSAVFNAMIDGGVSVISNSWASCEDQVTQADVQGIDAVLQTAAASGISVFNGAGDKGSSCLDGGASTISVPADSPSATAVGGTSFKLGSGFTYGSETWWDGSHDTPPTGQGGFGVSKFFSRPSYQDGLNSSSMRSIPDVAVAADPANGGMLICQADNGGCPSGSLFGGTSLAAPIWAAFTASLNARQGKNLGALNPVVYPLANTAAFHNAASMGSDFGHVGLGSPNLNALNRMLSGQALGTPDASQSDVVPLASSNVFVSGSGQSLSISGPADGQTPSGLLVTLRDANGNTVSGKAVTLSAGGGSAKIAPAAPVMTDSNGSALFLITDETPESITFTATDTSDNVVVSTKPSLAFSVPAATSGGLDVFPTTVQADGSSTTSLQVTLKDTLGRPTPGKQVNVSQGAGHSVITGPTPSVTDSNGQIVLNATDDVNETVTYTVVDATDGNLPVPGSGTAVIFSNAGASDCTDNPAIGAAGYNVSTFATGFPGGDFFFSNINLGGCPGADNPYFDASGSVLIPDFRTGDIYKIGADGGAVTSGNVLANLGPTAGTPVYGKDGSLYVSRFATGGGFTTGDVIQIDPASGTIVRELATGLTCPNSLAVDPLSGDLFFDDQCFGGGSDNPSLWRISGPAGTSPALSVYATLPGTSGQQQIAFSPNGTIYAMSGSGGNPTLVVQISGTDKPAPATANVIQGISPDNGSIAIGATNSDGSAKTLLLHVPGDAGGSLETIDISGSAPAVDTVLATGDIGAGIVGPDGCYYIGGHHVVYKLAPSNGVCTLTPTNPGPSLSLSPVGVSPDPAQGGTQTFTATLKNTTPLSGIPVFFRVTGANPQIKLVRTDAGGRAAFTYTAGHAGSDTVVASAQVSAPAAPQARQLAGLATHTRPAVAAFRPADSSAGPAYAGLKGGVPVGGVRYPAVSAHPASRLAADALALGGASSRDTASGTATLASNPAQVNWTAGLHKTSLTLNLSPGDGIQGQPVNLVASLVDVSASPAAGIANQPVDFAIGSAVCTGTTDTSGMASCVLIPTQAGPAALTASFAGSSQFTPANVTASFRGIAVPTGGSSSSGGGSSSSGSGGGVSSSGSSSGSSASGGGAVTPYWLMLGALALLLRRRAQGRRATS